MTLRPNHFFLSNGEHEIQGVILSDRRWIIGSSIGRALGMKTPKSFAKGLLKKPELMNWKESFVAEGFGVSREEKLFAIQRRVLSSSLAAFAVAHMRLSNMQISVFRMLLTVNQLGFDLQLSELPQDELIDKASLHYIKIN